jgi:pantoate--beta-alanine ligase
MRQVTTVSGMQRLARRWKAEGQEIGFVPTMGYLHAGHLSLVNKARQCAGDNGKVVVSIYVNPLQFGPQEDLSRYPRDLARDQKLCLEAGVDVLFVPSDQEMYPEGSAPSAAHSTYVLEDTLSRRLEGAARPAHFRGVSTVVAKLFNQVQPDYAVFGAKDYQQAAIVQRMVRDLNFPVKIMVAPTLRESDGLAMSSRNKYLSEPERAQAAVLWQAIQLAKKAVQSAAGPLAADALKQQLVQFIQAQPAARVDYADFFNPATFEPVAQVSHGTHLALAVFLGKTRLIDNAGL